MRAVDGLDLHVRQGEVFGLIGPNGSGKSTVANLVCGLFPATAGQVLLRGEEVGGLASHVRVARGVTCTFQNIRLFGQLSVWQNLWAAGSMSRAFASRRSASVRASPRWCRASRSGCSSNRPAC